MSSLAQLSITDAIQILRTTIQQHWLSILLVYIVGTAIRRRYFHPLSGFPGPFWASITDLYSCYIYLSRKQEQLEIELHKKYGPVFRYKINLLLVNDPTYLPVIYHKHVDKTPFQKASGLGFSAAVISAMPYKEHARLKKRLASSFSMTNIRGMEGAIDVRVREWISTIDRKFAQTKTAMDFGPWSQYYAYDVVSELAFGKPFGFVKNGSDVAGLIKSLHVAMPFAGILQRIPEISDILGLPILNKLLQPKPTDKIGVGAIMGFRNKLIRERIESGDRGTKDILGHLLNVRDDDGNPISEEDLNSELMIALLAGSDTTSAAFRHILKNLLANPTIFRRVVEEIDNAYDTGIIKSSPPNYDEILELKYFLSCLKESMRLNPPVPSYLPRMVSEPGYNILGHFIPPGTECAINAAVMAHHKAFGEDADVYNPDRYYNASEKELLRLEKLDFSWGYGSRACLGRNLAQVELYKVLVEFFRRFKPRWETCPEGQGPKTMVEENFGIWIQFGLWTGIERRDVKEWKISA